MRWIREYLPIMQQSNKWNNIKRNVLLGDDVIVDDSTPRNPWDRQKILTILPGTEGLVCSVLYRDHSKNLSAPASWSVAGDGE